MNYRHHEIAFLKLIDDKAQSKKTDIPVPEFLFLLKTERGRENAGRIQSAEYYRPMRGTEPKFMP